MGFPNCSTKLLSSLIFSAQIVGAFTATDGDCQYVLLRVTVAPHVLIASKRICQPLAVDKPYGTITSTKTFVFCLTDTTGFPKGTGTTWPATKH